MSLGLYENETPGARAVKAAHEYMEAVFDSPSSAALAWGCQRELVNYHVRKLGRMGIARTESSESSTVSKPVSQSSNSIHSPNFMATGCIDNETSAPAVADDLKYVKAWEFACDAMKKGQGKRAAATSARNAFGIEFSATSARNALLCNGEPPNTVGRPLNIPLIYETKVEDLCLLLREMSLPVFRSMVLSYMNQLVEGTDLAERFKHHEVRRDWYYRWLGRATRLTTGNLRPLEVARAQWATSMNAKTHYQMLADLLLKLKLAVPNPGHDPERHNSEPIFITHPGRVFSMDETRLTNDMTESTKSSQNRSIISVGDDKNFLANKGGGDGTGIGGSSADGLDTPAMFIFAKNIIHQKDVRTSNIPQCRRFDFANPGMRVPTRFWCNEKGGVTGDLGLRYIKGCIEPCLPDLSQEYPAVLIMDGHGSHFTLELLQYCRSVGIHIILRPPHTTHILQGEDVEHFARFKPAYHQNKMRVLGKNIFAHGAAKLTTADLLLAAKEPWESAFSLQRCQSAWAKIGVYPFTRCVMWELMETEQKSKRTAVANQVDPELLTMRGMVSTFFNISNPPQAGDDDDEDGAEDCDEDAPAPSIQTCGRKRDRDTLHSCDLWDLPGGATGDDCFNLIKTKTEARKAKEVAVAQKKQATAEKKSDTRSEMLQQGSVLMASLKYSEHVNRLSKLDLIAVLTFKGVEFNKNALKAELYDLVRKKLALPPLPVYQYQPVAPVPVAPVASGAPAVVAVHAAVPMVATPTLATYNIVFP